MVPGGVDAELFSGSRASAIWSFLFSTEQRASRLRYGSKRRRAIMVIILNSTIIISIIIVIIISFRCWQFKCKFCKLSSDVTFNWSASLKLSKILVRAFNANSKGNNHRHQLLHTEISHCMVPDFGNSSANSASCVMLLSGDVTFNWSAS